MGNPKNKIYWDMLLHDNYNDVPTMLKSMLDNMTYERVAIRLGVSLRALKDKCRSYGIYSPRGKRNAKQNR
jgi:hypothetical protein